MRKWRYGLALAALILVIVIVRSLMLTQLRVDSVSLQPALWRGDRVLVDRMSYGVQIPWAGPLGYRRLGEGRPVRRHIVAYHDPMQRNLTKRSVHLLAGDVCLGRCVLLPGDTLWLYVPAVGDTVRRDTWQPFVIPAKGQSVSVRPWNIALLINALHLHEGANVCPATDSSLVVDGREMTRVRFSQDYYWIRADRPTSAAYDSRVFGLLPASNLIGRALCVTYSIDPQAPSLQGWRWNRLLTSLD